MDGRVRIDVITPVGRTDPFLQEAGRSIAVFAELVDEPVCWWLVSDGPTDDWITQQAVGLPIAVRVLPAEAVRQGPARTRNRGLRAGSAPVVMALDSDDAWIPGEMAELYRAFEHTGVAWAAGRITDVHADGSHRWNGPVIHLGDGPAPAGAFLDHWLTHGVVPFHCGATIARRAVVEAVGGYDVSATFTCGEDVAMWARISRGEAGWFSHRPVMLKRFHDASVTREFGHWNVAGDLVAERLDDTVPSSGRFTDDVAYAQRMNAEHAAAGQRPPRS